MENEKKEIANQAMKYEKVQSLMKYVNKDTLKEMYKKQPKNKAVGIDGMTKEKYGEKTGRKYRSITSGHETVQLSTIARKESIYS